MTQCFVLDKALILDRLGGDEEIFAMMVDLYLQDVESYIDALNAALTSADAVVLSREAHTVKGLLATFSDDQGAETAFMLEQRAKAGDLNGLQTIVAKLEAHLRELALALKSEIGAAG